MTPAKAYNKAVEKLEAVEKQIREERLILLIPRATREKHLAQLEACLPGLRADVQEKWERTQRK